MLPPGRCQLTLLSLPLPLPLPAVRASSCFVWLSFSFSFRSASCPSKPPSPRPTTRFCFRPVIQHIQHSEGPKGCSSDTTPHSFFFVTSVSVIFLLEERTCQQYPMSLPPLPPFSLPPLPFFSFEDISQRVPWGPLPCLTFEVLRCTTLEEMQNLIADTLGTDSSDIRLWVISQPLTDGPLAPRQLLRYVTFRDIRQSNSDK